MIRLLIPVLLAVAVCGCQGQEAHVPMDPFYGQTKIAPPGTGEIARGSRVDPAYPRSAAASPSYGNLTPPPGVLGEASPSGSPTASLASNSTAESKSLAPASPGDRIKIPISARRELSPSELAAATSKAAPPPSAAAGATASASPQLEPKRVSQTLRPREQSVAGQSAGSSHPAPPSGPLTPRGAPVDINYLPPVDRGAGTLRDDRVQQASATDADGGMPVRIPTRVDASDSRGRFGWYDDYSRLRGQLEYLERDGCWKLRYIPVDRETDRYGGSVMIADSSSLSGFERGDYVEIHGRIAGELEDAKDFAPTYEVAEIRSLDR